jgi:hypothetical protein
MILFREPTLKKLRFGRYKRIKKHAYADNSGQKNAVYKTHWVVPITINMPKASFLSWLKQLSTEDDCLKYLQKIKWTDGFICPRCGNDHHYEIKNRHL